MKSAGPRRGAGIFIIAWIGYDSARKTVQAEAPRAVHYEMNHTEFVVHCHRFATQACVVDAGAQFHFKTAVAKLPIVALNECIWRWLAPLDHIRLDNDSSGSTE